MDADVSRRAPRTLDQLHENVPARDVEVKIQPGLCVQADPALLDTLLGNLLENAWEFTSRHAHTRIEGGRASTPRGDAVFVRDDGAGFDHEFTDKPFQRLHGQREFPGTGIGLALAKRIVATYGGDIWAEGSPGRGATFYSR